MNRKTIADLICSARAVSLLAIVLVVSCVVAPVDAHATGKPPDPAPVPNLTSTSAADAAARAKAGAKAASKSTSSVGDVSQGLSIGDDRSRFLSLAFAPPAFTPPMAEVEGCAAEVTQEADSVTVWSRARSKADPSVCHLLTLRNLKVQQCQYASAKQIEDLLVARMLPGFVASPQVDYLDLPRSACALLHTAPPAEPAKPVNYLYSLTEPAMAPTAAASAPALCAATAPPKPAVAVKAKKGAGKPAVDDECKRNR